MKIGTKLLIPIFAALVASGGCSGDEPVAGEDHVCADIIVLTPLAGVGDVGYNDEALAGILESAGSSGLEVSILRPRTLAQAEEYAVRWRAHEENKRRLLVLADTEYGQIAGRLHPDEGESVLLFESDGADMPDGIASFRISRYGIAYLSGCLARGKDDIHLIAAHKNDPTADEAMDAFSAGYSAGNPAGKIMRHYLNDTYAGFAMPDSLYRLAGEYPDDFFFPIAKGSNTGLFKFSREHPFVLALIAGMDVDCSLLSKRVPFSVIIDIKPVVADYLSRWIAGEDISGHKDYGMEDGTASIRMSRRFYTDNDIWEEWYTRPQYWTGIYNDHYQEALNKEKEYETSRQ